MKVRGRLQFTRWGISCCASSKVPLNFTRRCRCSWYRRGLNRWSVRVLATRTVVFWCCAPTRTACTTWWCTILTATGGFAPSLECTSSTPSPGSTSTRIAMSSSSTPRRICSSISSKLERGSASLDRSGRWPMSIVSNTIPFAGGCWWPQRKISLSAKRQKSICSTSTHRKLWELTIRWHASTLIKTHKLSSLALPTAAFCLPLTRSSCLRRLSKISECLELCTQQLKCTRSPSRISSWLIIANFCLRLSRATGSVFCVWREWLAARVDTTLSILATTTSYKLLLRLTSTTCRKNWRDCWRNARLSSMSWTSSRNSGKISELLKQKAWILTTSVNNSITSIAPSLKLISAKPSMLPFLKNFPPLNLPPKKHRPRTKRTIISSYWPVMSKMTGGRTSSVKCSLSAELNGRTSQSNALRIWRIFRASYKSNSGTSNRFTWWWRIISLTTGGGWRSRASRTGQWGRSKWLTQNCI